MLLFFDWRLCNNICTPLIGRGKFVWPIEYLRIKLSRICCNFYITWLNSIRCFKWKAMQPIRMLTVRHYELFFFTKLCNSIRQIQSIIILCLHISWSDIESSVATSNHSHKMHTLLFQKWICIHPLWMLLKWNCHRHSRLIYISKLWYRLSKTIINQV